MTFRIGVIGAGIHGTRYLRHALADVPGMTPTALCRGDEMMGAQLAGEFGIRYHAEAAALIADPAVDGVIVATPPAPHFDQARAVLTAGKALLLEKPMTAWLSEAVELAAMPGAGAPGVMLAQTLRWNPVILKTKELWPRLGRVHLVRMAQRLGPTTLAWQHDPAIPSGGSVLITGVHLFDTVRFLTGAEFTGKVTARVEKILNEAVEDFFLATATLSDGCAVSLEVSKYTQSRACWLEAVGESGQLWADYRSGGLELRCGSEETRFDVNATVPTLPLVLRAWLDSVRDGTPAPVTFADGVATLRMVDAVYRSGG
ncbi:hypothetical protein CO151_14000 [bacterium CG_4_9_14_3_um_filter_65_15]|nr:MAG: hypothetical protein CO151_14000 [bacterium CG_4_9_14_3_um_filter_65_15]